MFNSNIEYSFNKLQSSKLRKKLGIKAREFEETYI